MGPQVDKETPQERRRRYKKARKERDPEGWKKYRREMKRRMRERRRDPNRLRKGEKARMSPEERREHERAVNRRSRLRKEYGLTHGEYDAMVARQDGKCVICTKPCEMLVVDHCHIGGHVRGLLCNFCNTGLGFFRDNPFYLVSAAQYVARNAPSGVY